VLELCIEDINFNRDPYTLDNMCYLHAFWHFVSYLNSIALYYSKNNWLRFWRTNISSFYYSNGKFLRMWKKHKPEHTVFKVTSIFKACIYQYFTKREGCHKTILTPPHFIEVPVQSQESERSCICMLGVSNLLLSTTLIVDYFGLFRQCGTFCFSRFWIVPTVWYFGLFRQCGIFVYHYFRIWNLCFIITIFLGVVANAHVFLALWPMLMFSWRCGQCSCFLGVVANAHVFLALWPMLMCSWRCCQCSCFSIDSKRLHR
jgi:hypothetical protein